MLAPSRRALLVGLCALAACGRGGPEPYRAELTEPWSTMGLPVAEGRVVYSDDKMLTVHFEPGEIDDLTATWTEAMLAAGLARGADSSGQDMRSITFSGSEAVVALGVIEGPGRVEVSLTSYPRL